MSAYTPEIYRRFATPLTLDLGPTADGVTAIHTITQAIRAQTDQLPQLADAVAEAGQSADQALTVAREILERLPNCGTPPLHASAHAWPLLRVLVQAMTQVLDQTPDEIHSGKDAQHKGRLKNDVTLEQLRDSIDPTDLNRLDTAPGHLRARFLQAFDRLHTADQNRRAERLDTLHVLMGEVARHLK